MSDCRTYLSTTVASNDAAVVVDNGQGRRVEDKRIGRAHTGNQRPVRKVHKGGVPAVRLHGHTGVVRMGAQETSTVHNMAGPIIEGNLRLDSLSLSHLQHAMNFHIAFSYLGADLVAATWTSFLATPVLASRPQMNGNIVFATVQ